MAESHSTWWWQWWGWVHGTECWGLVSLSGAKVVGGAQVLLVCFHTCVPGQVQSGAHRCAGACMCAWLPCPADSLQLCVCVSTAMCRHVQVCAGVCRHAASVHEAPVQSSHIHVQAHTHVETHGSVLGTGGWTLPWQRESQSQIKTGTVESPTQGHRGWNWCAVVMSSHQPQLLFPSASFRAPSLLWGLHMGLGQTPAKWAWGGCISKPLARANAAAPPPGCHLSMPPDLSIAPLVGWGQSCPTPQDS